MSHVVVLAPVGSGLGVLVLGVAGLMEALAETGLECLREESLRTDDGTAHRVDLVVRDEEGTRVGVRVDAATGRAELIAADCKTGGVKGRALAQRIVQRHAVHRAMSELQRKGYKITKQQSAADGTLTVVAQRWR